VRAAGEEAEGAFGGRIKNERGLVLRVFIGRGRGWLERGRKKEEWIKRKRMRMRKRHPGR